MDILTYRVLHQIGIIVLFTGLGAALALARAPKGRGIALAIHGIGLLMVLVAGFGLLAKARAGEWEGWIIAKVGIWLLVACLPMFARKGIVPVALAWVLGFALGGTAVWLAVMKPF